MSSIQARLSFRQATRREPWEAGDPIPPAIFTKEKEAFFKPVRIENDQTEGEKNACSRKMCFRLCHIKTGIRSCNNPLLMRRRIRRSDKASTAMA